MQEIEIITPQGTETRCVLDPATLIGLSKLNVWGENLERDDVSRIWLFLHRHFLKYPLFEFENLIENQKAFLHRLAADYTDFWNDLKLDFEEISPSVVKVLGHQGYLRNLRIHNYKGERIPMGFEVVQQIESLTIEGKHGLDVTNSQFDWKPILSLCDNLDYLSLENVGMTEIDPFIVMFRKLKVLSLDDNPLKSLPDFLFQIPSRPLLLLRGTQVPEAELEARAKEYPHIKFSY